MMVVVAVFVLMLSFGTNFHYSTSRGAKLMPEDTAEDLLAKQYWLYGLRVQLPDNPLLSYTKWDTTAVST